jgi:cell cycle sensor histidine kinase DivJ
MTAISHPLSSLGDGGSEAASWHAGWALSVGAGAALLLTALGAAPITALGALACSAVPGVAGWLLRPSRGHGVYLLLVWAIACALAMALTGGVSGPLMIWGLAPILAAAAMGGLWLDGATFSFAAFAGVALIQFAGKAAPTPTGPVAFSLGLIGIATTLAGAVVALTSLTKRRDALAQSFAQTGGQTAGQTGAQTGGQTAGQTGAETAAESIAAKPALITLAAPDSQMAELRAQLEDAVAAREAAESDAKAKIRFLANMSHELRTPLNAIMGFSDIMRARLFGDLPGKYGEYAELIHESGVHLLDLINDVLDMSKIEADKYDLALEVFDVREPVNAALRIMRAQADDVNVHLRAVLPPVGLDVEADRRAIKQVVLNLVSNALKYTPAGGTVTVTVQTASDALEIAVSDTGVGIAPEDLERLGRPFEQAGDSERRARGTGLGLSLVAAFARLHGGQMVVESQLGEGAAFTVRMPVLVLEATRTALVAQTAAQNAAKISAALAGKADGETSSRPGQDSADGFI